MNSIERVLETLRFGIPDRIPIFEYPCWSATIEKWHKEGLSELPEKIRGVSSFLTRNYIQSMDIIHKHLGMDRTQFVSFFDQSPGFERKILSETDDYAMVMSSYGDIRKHWKEEAGYGPGQTIDFPIKSESDWLEYKNQLIASEERIASRIEETLEYIRKTDSFIFLSQREPCWSILCNVMGLDRGLSTMYKNPELFDDMLRTFTVQLIEMCKIIEEKGMDYDGVYLRGDLCYKNGMLFSPKIYESLLHKYHKEVCSFFRKRNKPVVHHCDGNVFQYIPLIIESGFTGIEPLEVRAGNDVRELKRKWAGKIVLLGNISVETLSSTKKAIRKEVTSKVPIAMEEGGYVFKSDHTLAPTISLENYAYAVKLAKEYGRY